MWLTHSAVLRQSGEAAGASERAEKALQASHGYDAYSADSIKLANAVLQAAK